MFVINDTDQKVPIFVWLDNIDQIEPECLNQAKNLSRLPFAYKYISLQADTHCGYGMPIGGVLACENVVIPNAVGSDVACGMAFVETNIPVKLLKEVDTPNGKLINAIIGDILRNVPVGFEHHKDKQPCNILDWVTSDLHDNIKYKIDTSCIYNHKELIPELKAGYYQVGTLGGGNHFIEIQEDDNGMACIMVHSGSRNFGFKICKYFNELAKKLNKKWHVSVPSEYDLAFLPTDTEEGKSYIAWMNIALEFAEENRQHMINAIKTIFQKNVLKYTSNEVMYSGEINAHHNYAALEHHGNKNVWVHRKGAIRVRKDEVGIVPGAMGSFSYIVRGKGNEKSFDTCSHGAGRAMSRKKASEKFNVQSVMEDLKTNGVILGKKNKEDVTEECKGAYKDIDFVISQQLTIIDPIKKLFTVGVVKG